eukprot:RCo037770
MGSAASSGAAQEGHTEEIRKDNVTNQENVPGVGTGTGTGTGKAKKRSESKGGRRSTRTPTESRVTYSEQPETSEGQDKEKQTVGPDDVPGFEQPAITTVMSNISSRAGRSSGSSSAEQHLPQSSSTTRDPDPSIADAVAAVMKALTSPLQELKLPVTLGV